MAYNRNTSHFALALKGMAWLCDNWLWPVIAIVLLPPFSPHVLIAGDYGICTYAGRLGIISDYPDQPDCPTIKFFSVY